MTKQETAPSEWAAHSPAGYFMRADGTDDGRLVRLADVVRWLMHSKELPLNEAVAAACSALEQAQPAPTLFYVDKAAYAKPIADTALFGNHSEASWAAAKAKALQEALQREHEDRERSAWRGGFTFQNGRIGVRTPAIPILVEPGFPAAVLCMRSTWTNAKDIETRLDKRNLYATHFALRLEAAAKLWGYEAIAKPGLFEAVTAAADESATAKWIEGTSAGAISAVQFLAVVLTIVSKDGATVDDERHIVAAWGQKLADSTAVLVGGARHVVPFDPVTMLPLPGRPTSWDWLLAVDDADTFLESLGAGWRCSEILDYWRQRGEVNKPAERAEPENPGTQSGQQQPAFPDALRRRKKGSRWTDNHKTELRDFVSTAGHGGQAAAARALDITEARVSELIASLGKDLSASTWPAAVAKRCA